MYYLAYNKLFWGFVFVFIRINIGNLDLLPNFIGYFLIYNGVNTLISQHRAFNNARVPALLMCILSIKDVYKARPQYFLDTSIITKNILWIFYDEIGFIIMFYIVFCVVRAIYLLAEERELEELSKNAKNYWRAYFITASASSIINPFLLNLSKDWKVLYFILITIAFVTTLFIMGLMLMARKELGNDRSGAEAEG